MKHVDSTISKSRYDYEKEAEDMKDETLEDLGKTDSADGVVTLRSRIALILTSPTFEALLSVVIVSNMATVVLEANAQSRGAATMEFALINRLLLAVYAFEMLMRLYVLQMKFFRSSLNIFEGSLVVIDVMFEIFSSPLFALFGNLPPLQMLRAVRIIRMLRMLRVFSKSPELYVMLYSLAGAMKAVAWASLLISYVIIMWAVVAVEVLHPLNLILVKDGTYDDLEKCGHHFATVWEASLTFLQTVLVGDSWGVCSLPLIHAYPWTVFILLAVLLSINLGILNLIMAVIVDRAEEVRADDHAHKLKQKMEGLQKAKRSLLKMCYDIDKDRSGMLTYEELLIGFSDNEDAQQLFTVMDVGKQELGIIFKILDQDGSGSVSYHEFVEQFYKLTTQDSHTLLIFIKYHIQEMRRHLCTHMDTTLESILKREHQILDQEHQILDQEKQILATEEEVLANTHGLGVFKSASVEERTSKDITPNGNFASTVYSGQSLLQNPPVGHAPQMPEVGHHRENMIQHALQLEMQLTTLKKEVSSALENLITFCLGFPELDPRRNHLAPEAPLEGQKFDYPACPEVSASNASACNPRCNAIATFAHEGKYSAPNADTQMRSASAMGTRPKALDVEGCCSVRLFRAAEVRSTPPQSSTR